MATACMEKKVFQFEMHNTKVFVTTPEIESNYILSYIRQQRIFQNLFKSWNASRNIYGKQEVKIFNRKLTMMLRFDLKKNTFTAFRTPV